MAVVVWRGSPFFRLLRRCRQLLLQSATCGPRYTMHRVGSYERTNCCALSERAHNPTSQPTGQPTNTHNTTTSSVLCEAFNTNRGHTPCTSLARLMTDESSQRVAARVREPSPRVPGACTGAAPVTRACSAVRGVCVFWGGGQGARVPMAHKRGRQQRNSHVPRSKVCAMRAGERWFPAPTRHACSAAHDTHAPYAQHARCAAGAAPCDMAPGLRRHQAARGSTAPAASQESRTRRAERANTRAAT
jgi:hypothetical protein